MTDSGYYKPAKPLFGEIKNQNQQTSQEKLVMLHIEKLCKQFDNHIILDDVTLSIRQGEIFVLLGESGAGKSTLLQILAGFGKPSSGKIYLENQDITEIPPYKRPINIMFQNYALFPHMNVEKNIAFGLKQEHLSKTEIKKRVTELLSLVHMEKYANRHPHQLSGGQQQRIALARCLAKRPKVILLDEPMGALDKKLRTKMQLEVVDILDNVGATCLMVTHDREEAMTMADRIGIMDNGWIVQEGTPVDLYENPNSRMVAEFIGSVNIFSGNIVSQDAGYVVIKCDCLPSEIYIGHGITPVLESTKVWVAIRPEKIKLTTHDPVSQYNYAQGVVDDIAYLGSHSIYYVRLPSQRIIQCNIPNTAHPAIRPTWDDEIHIHWEANSGMVLNS